ncbi:MAG TPA: hypothetical protein VN673_08730 [Clostridia bacterium]|nr:hypothetical protein [Clostridia bacterium]
MKQTLTLLIVVIAGVAAAQTTTPSTPTPGAGGAAGAGTPITPQTPGQPPGSPLPSRSGALTPAQSQAQAAANQARLSALSQTNLGFGTATLSNLFGNQTFTNELGNQFSAAELGIRLARIEAEIQATLPLLAAFNSQSDLRVASAGTPTSTRNFASNAGTNFASRSSANVARNVAVPTGPVFGPSTSTPRALQPTGVTDPGGLRPGFNTNAFPITASDTMRALLILQNDMERMLPILSAFNEGTSFGAGPVTEGVGITNRLDGQRMPGVDLDSNLSR